MSTLAVNSIIPANAGSEDYFLARAWVAYNMSGTAAVLASANVSSLTDQGTGNPLFTMSTALPSASGTTWNTPGLYSGGQEYPIQSGGSINSTTQFEAYCGSDSTARVDWQLGYSGVIR